MARSSEPVIAAARTIGADVTHTYGRLVSGFAARMDLGEARAVAGLQGVASVAPAAVVQMFADSGNERAAASTASMRKVRGGRGIHVAVIDSGVDYTHAAFGGKGTRAAYERNDPDRIERGSFPTSKVVGGYDFVGDNYGVTDQLTSNDVPEPDRDPLDRHGHGTHVASICCGKRTEDVRAGVAPKVKILAYKVWDQGDSTADVLVAAFERAVDPNGDGSFEDKPDVINFSGGVNFGDAGAAESLAAQRAVDLGVVVVAAAGNAGNEMAGDGDAYRVGAPATAPDVIAVAAHDRTPEIAFFSSEGPSRTDAVLKPDISALGEDVFAAGVGSGTLGASLSGTSMASPQVAGGAALLAARHPGWGPERIKAALMNNAGAVKGPGGRRAPAPLKGAGRMRIKRSLEAKTLAMPGSISFGRAYSTSEDTFLSAPVTVKNTSGVSRTYTPSASFGSTQLGRAPFSLEVIDESGIAAGDFTLASGDSTGLRVELTIDPTLVDAAKRLRSWYRDHPDTDGSLAIESHRGEATIRVPWHIVPVPSTAMSASPSSLVLAEGESGHVEVTSDGTFEAHADAFLLGAPDDLESGGEEDISHIAARSFAGAAIDGQAEGLPNGFDPLRGLTWLDFLSPINSLDEPVEFLIRTHSARYTTETLRATVFIDAGADGVYVDDEKQADFTVELTQDGWSCFRNLEENLQRCSAQYRPNYPYYDTNLLGLPVEAADLGLTEGASEISYRVEVCTDLFSGDVAQPVCDEAGSTELAVNGAAFDVLDPSIVIEPLICGGPWDGAPCSEGFTVRKRSDGDSGEVVLIFPSGPPAENLARLAVQ